MRHSLALPRRSCGGLGGGAVGGWGVFFSVSGEMGDGAAIFQRLLAHHNFRPVDSVLYQVTSTVPGTR